MPFEFACNTRHSHLFSHIFWTLHYLFFSQLYSLSPDICTRSLPVAGLRNLMTS